MAFWKSDPLVSGWIDELGRPSTVPEQAERYHRLRKRLRDDLQRYQKRRLVLGGSSQVRRFESRIRNLESLEGDLTPLVGQAQELSQQVQQLERKARSAGRIAAPVRKRCDQWFASLAQLGASAARRGEILQDRAQLQRISEQVHLFQECVHAFSEAGRLLRGTPSDPEIEALRSDLERKQGQVGQADIDQAWLDEVQKLLSALTDKMRGQQPSGSQQGPAGQDQGQDSGQHLSELIEKASRWIRVLDAASVPVAAASRRFRSLRRAVSGGVWGAHQATGSDGRLEEIQSILEVLCDEAKQVRGQRQDRLEEYARQYQRVLGADAGLKESIGKLDEFLVHSPQEHEGWLRMASEAETRFRGLANIRKEDLGKSLSSRLKELGKRAAAFSKRPLFRQQRERLAGIKRRLAAIQSSDELEAILQGIAEGSQLERELNELQNKAEEQIRQVGKQKAHLAARCQKLSKAARRAGLSGPEAFPLEQLEDAAALESDQQAHALIRDLADRLQAMERQMVLDCLERMAGLSQDCAEIAAALAGLDQEHRVEVPDRKIGESSPLEKAVQEVERFQEAKGRAETLLQQGIGQLLERREALRAELQAVVESGSGRERRSGYLDELFAQGAFESSAPLEALAGLRRTVRRAQALRDSFFKDRRMAQELMQGLPRRLNELEGRGLHSHLPRHALLRLTGLIEGVREPCDWRSARLQLEEAERLIGNLEQHALSLADLRPQKEMVS